MGRFSKGTLDHDGDGRMGGSRKADDMTKDELQAIADGNIPNAKTLDKLDKGALRKLRGIEADGKNRTTFIADLDRRIGDEPSDAANESGQQGSENIADRKAETQAKFDKADNDVMLGLQIRGY